MPDPREEAMKAAPRDESMLRFLATSVMGWYWDPPLRAWCVGDGLVSLSTWNPLESWSDMGQLWERSVEKFSIRLTGPFSLGDQWHCGVNPTGVTGWNGRPDWQAVADSGPRAVTEAIAKAFCFQEPQS